MPTGPPTGLQAPTAIAEHPLVLRAARLADELLVPHAQEVDVAGVPRSHVDAFREAGLIGVTGPASCGGGEAPPPVEREITEILAGACGSSWFVLTQHKTPLAMVAGSPDARLRDRWLPQLCTGRILAGVAIAHVRRPGEPPVRARHEGHGWVVDGTVGWFTGWGLADVFLLGAWTAGDELAFFLVDAEEQPGLTAAGDLPLAAMGGTHTTALALDGLRIGADRLVDRVPRDNWMAADRLRTANANPAVFGLLRAVVRALGEAGERRRSVEASELAADLREEAGTVRARAYQLIDHVPAADRLDERLGLRAHATELAVRASGALVAAQAGGAMLLSAPAQRWAREALFHQIQAQTGAVRAAQLRRYQAVGR